MGQRGGVGKVLEVSSLTKSYDRLTGVFDLSFDVHEHEIVGLLGPNGSGKSTALHCLTGILQETAGSVLIAGIPHRQVQAKNAFGFLPDDLPLPASLRMREFQVFHRRLRPGLDSDLAEFLIDLLGLKAHADKYIGDYSHGMKRKLQLAIALAHRPKLLILDEPMRGLDPQATIIVRSLFDIFTSQGGAVLVATHDLRAAQEYCNRVVILAGGRTIAQGSPKGLAGEAGVQSLEQYFIRATGVETELGEVQRKLKEVRYVHVESDKEAVGEFR
jgi:ABC-2 type transport system ATP-binding protein